MSVEGETYNIASLAPVPDILNDVHLCLFLVRAVRGGMSRREKGESNSEGRKDAPEYSNSGKSSSPSASPSFHLYLGSHRSWNKASWITKSNSNEHIAYNED